MGINNMKNHCKFKNSRKSSNLRSEDIILIKEFGEDIGDYIIVTNKAAEKAISILKKKIDRIGKLRNAKITATEIDTITNEYVRDSSGDNIISYPFKVAA